MKSRILLTSLLLAVFFISCKNEDKKESETLTTSEQPVVNKNTFSVTLNAIVTEDDSFQIFYKDVEGATFEEKNSFFIEFKGSDQPQDIVFNLPEDVLPNFLRLDFGTNKNQKDITVNSFKIDYLGKTFEVKGKDFFTYFYSNELVKVDAENAKVTPVTSKEGNYDPVFVSAEGLKKQIDLLIK